jgi:hypothetical protein
VFEVFRFALFAVRTFFGVIALVLTLYAALWLFVKILSAAPGNDEPRGALGRVESYNSQVAVRNRAAPDVRHDATRGCSELRHKGCDRR